MVEMRARPARTSWEKAQEKGEYKNNHAPAAEPGTKRAPANEHPGRPALSARIAQGGRRAKGRCIWPIPSCKSTVRQPVDAAAEDKPCLEILGRPIVGAEQAASR